MTRREMIMEIYREQGKTEEHARAIIERTSRMSQGVRDDLSREVRPGDKEKMVALLKLMKDIPGLSRVLAPIYLKDEQEKQ